LELQDPLNNAVLGGGGSVEKTRKSLQEKLLFPFGRIKNLMKVEVSGTPFPNDAVVAEMKRLMAIPLGSPTERLIAAAAHKDAGNAALMANQPLEALEHYRKAWEAMFIIVNGKHRKLHGEGYFDTTLTEPPFEGQYGGMVRTVLRVRLVANSLLAHLKLKDWDTVVHIGMRTINIMRGGQEGLEPEQEASNGWIAGSEMGKIYYRTALAFKEMDDKYEARRLLKVAVLYLPNDGRVREMIRECALRLG
jgi:tetratricopeptide (TPR) repeat protein